MRAAGRGRHCCVLAFAVEVKPGRHMGRVPGSPPRPPSWLLSAAGQRIDLQQQHYIPAAGLLRGAEA